jgi:N-acetyl-anhydromuramyl-L-alanine amidase AmpD
MKRIIVHWSAGTHKVSDTEKQHYHYIVAGDGTIVNGIYKPEDNLSVKDGKYAAHTRGCNTGSIGVAMAGMFGAEGPGKLGKYPLTKAQWDACMGLIKRLAAQYKIPVTPGTILTHAEVQSTLGIKQNGKIDISFGVPGRPDLNTAKECGDFIRDSIK